jgi:TP901 family phage tail tape measure protein
VPRYGGGHEDLNNELRLVNQVAAGTDDLVGKEKTLRGERGKTTEATKREVAERERLLRLQQEQADVQQRLERTAGTEAERMARTTAEIEANTVARERNVRAALNQARALRGAQDPLFGRAFGLGSEGLPPTQYAMRQQLGVGQGRAQRLQEAVRAGYAPAPTAGGRLQGPLVGEAAIAQANKELAAAKRALKTATNADDRAAMEEAASAVDLAKARRAAATAHLKSARSSERAAQVDAEAAARAGVAPSTALVPRTAAAGAVGGRIFGADPFRGDLARYGRNVPDRVFGVGGAGDEGPTVRTGPRGGRYSVEAIQQATQANRGLAAAEQEEARAAGLQARTHASQAAALNAGQTERLARATRFAAVEYGTANQQMRQHGTLTSEFIQAALRGETTLKEIGNQAIVTAGKFGAWTGAATAIFGAVSAVHQLGAGAIASSSGVNQLQRVVNNVNADQLKQSFSDLAGQFNVPVDVATDAVYQMGKVFHNQADAVEASKAALYSYKTGEVDVAESTQNLIAIVNGFGLSAQDLTKVYDQINQAQNKFGIGIGDVEQGLAKAGGTYRNAGGDLNYLLALFVAIQKATGRSGTEIGTGISRGVNEIRKPINQARLKAQGVDVDPQNFQKTLQSALEAAKKPNADLQQIASGLMGNQYARLIAPVLRDQTRLNAAIKDTSPEASKGSAQRELARVLSSVDEQLKKVGVTLQRLGAALAQAGLGDIPYLLLRGLNATLDVATKLVEVFDKLPAPLRHALALFAQIALVMRVIRRFGGLPGIAERVPGLGGLAAPDQRAKSLAVKGARDAEAEANRALESSTSRASSLHQSASVRAEQTRLYNAQFEHDERSGLHPAVGTKEHLALQDERVRINQESIRAEEEAAAATREANVQRRLALDATNERVRLERLDAATVRAEAEIRQLPVPASHNVPEPRGAVISGGRFSGNVHGGPGSPGAAIGLAGGGGRDVTAHIAELERQAEEFEQVPKRTLGRFEQAVLPYTSGLRLWGERVEHRDAAGGRHRDPHGQPG